MANVDAHYPEDQKPSFLWKVIKSMVLVLFPGIRLLKINQGLKRVDSFYHHEWFKKQRRRNLFVSLLVSLPVLFTATFSSLVLYKAQRLWSFLAASQSSFMKMEITRGFDLLSKAFSNPDTMERLGIVFQVMSVGLVVSVILGSFVILSHPLIRESKKLYEMLQKAGVIDKNEHHRLVIATPLGFLIDITGNTAKEVKDNERIWMALNLRITDWAEDPHQRAICFFKKSYDLKKEYIYEF